MHRLGTALAVLAMTSACSGKVSGTVAMLVIAHPMPAVSASDAGPGSDAGDSDAGASDAGFDGGALPSLDAGMAGDAGTTADAGPATVTGPYWRLVAEDVTTLRNLQSMSGGAAALRLGGTVTVNPGALLATNPQTQSAFDKAVVTKPSTTPTFDFIVASGVVHPVDTTGLALTTTYYNFEQAQLFFQSISPSAALPAVTVRIDPQLIGSLQGNLSPLTDDPLSQPFLHEFIVETASPVPGIVSPYLQLGVVGHKYAHAVFQNLVFPGGGLPWLESKLATNPTQYQEVSNLVRSIDEGLADYFGAAIASDAEFIRTKPTVPDATRQLDPSAPRCLTPDVTTSLAMQTRAEYDPYLLGSILSAALWNLATTRTELVPELNQSLLAGMTELGARLQHNDSEETLADALDAFASKLSPDLQPIACGELLDRFRMTRENLPSCSASRAPEQSCASSP